MIADIERMLAAAAVLAAYAALCTMVVAAERRKGKAAAREAAALLPATRDDSPVLVAFASQTGTAQSLAWQTARLLRAADVPSRVLALSELAADDLRRAQRVLFLVSTYGEGDPPDNAALFARRLMSAQVPLQQLRYGLLALGDRAYANFRGFGLALEQWLAWQGARPLFERIDVDGGDEAALRDWQQRLGGIAGTAETADWQAPAFVEWRLRARRHLNPGSAGNPLFHVELVAPPGPAPRWEAGDLLQVRAPGDEGRARDYSIASLPSDGSVHLLVRQELRRDGSLGVACSWLTREAAPCAPIVARIRVHENFRLGANAARPLILVGNGSGLAGLLGLIRARVQAGVQARMQARMHAGAQANGGPGRIWLLYGERHAATDFHHKALIRGWQREGILERADLVFSRDQPARRYVQHRLAEAADEVRRWVGAGAAIYVCGSRVGMAAGVDQALAAILDRSGLDALALAGRYRRDVY